ncbi:MAG: cytochrome c3 family protein [Acidobacteriia bacterium]|nr:cytochrome c3 family protein [Terriglobia bacterium]
MRTLLAAAFLSLALHAQVSRTPPKPPAEFKTGPPVVQPLPFSHKTHSATGLKCLECHPIKDAGDYAGFPPESKCMACHITIKKESPAIRKLKQPVVWNRVYRLQEFVYFSHQVHHRKAGLDCALCHGPVASREVLFQEKPLDMFTCMKCHQERKAPNHCEVCHDTH